MKQDIPAKSGRIWLGRLCILVILLALPVMASADITINVTGQDDSVVPPTRAPLANFRWLVQEDNTNQPVLGQLNNYNSLSVSIHESNAKVVASGTAVAGTPAVATGLPTNKRYMVSVLSTEGYTMNGAVVLPGQTSVNVTLHKLPIKAAQVSVFVFEDNMPINGAPDLPGERPLPNFKLMVYDQAGQMSRDYQGNPIGTIYDATGSNVVQMGPGYIMTNDGGDNLVGNALIPNLAPGKYGIRAIPQDGLPWIQTSTIEGTPGIDVWVIAGEPPVFTEAGFFNVHAFIGFVLPTSYYQSIGDTTTNQFRPLALGETAGSVKGWVVNNRFNRPPANWGFNPGEAVTNALVGLSDLGLGNRQVYAGKVSSMDGGFNITGVPPGTYTLTMWDEPLDNIIDFRTVVVPPTGGEIDMGQIPVFRWFGTLEGTFFTDLNDNGVQDAGETPLQQQVVNLRFRDGAIYASTTTDMMGNYAFNEVFPFFKWLVVDSDYANYKPSGAMSYVDKGGALANGTAATGPSFWPGPPVSNPQIPLLETRKDPAGTLLEGMMLYMGFTNRIDFLRQPYAAGENGGISGVVYYAAQRTHEDARNTVATGLMPGVPTVQLDLYRVTGYDTAGKPIVEATPVATTYSDAWANNKPSGCLATMQAAGIDINAGGIPLEKYVDCAEVMPVWNQVKVAAFDGGYIFTDYLDPATNTRKPLPPGDYVVKVTPPFGHEIVKPEDYNVIFGESYVPSVPQPTPAALLPTCAGADHVVPATFSFDGTPIDSTTPQLFASVGTNVPLCDAKLVRLQEGQNAAADFFVFSQVPIAGRIVGLVTDDLALEFRPGNPRLSDKIGPSFMPISVQDFSGRELVRTYTDEWGQYNALVPSTYTNNIPSPSGISPHMVRVVLNYPGTPDAPDPWYNPNYVTQTVWQFDIWPGKITYVDTPIIPIRPSVAASPLDCDLPDRVPAIKEINGSNGGPYTPDTAPYGRVTLTAVGKKQVQNPTVVGGALITRDYGFGSPPGKLFAIPAGTSIDQALPPTELSVVNWTPASITFTPVADGTPLTPGPWQILVLRGDSGMLSQTGITLHVGVPAANVRKVVPGPKNGDGLGPIQQAIDAANPGDLVLVTPGVYPENIIMWKPVNLQGYGPAASIIKAPFFGPPEEAQWTAKFNAIIANGGYLIPGEQPDFFVNQEAGSGILVLASDSYASSSHVITHGSIDGLQVEGAIQGSGIFVNAYAHGMRITNNRLISNQGTFGGGIRVGTPSVLSEPPTGFEGSANEGVYIAHNQVISNGATGLAIASGAGIGLFKGSDGYAVADNWICGNYSFLAGSGIGHQGVSSGGVIKNNKILFNEAFDEGAGLFIAGEFPVANAVPLVSEGAGSVTVTGNLFQGNKAGDLGGGIAIMRMNGVDVAASPDSDASWYEAFIANNLIVNNLSGGYGGGIALADALKVKVLHNTVANNDTTSTGELAFGNIPWITEGAVLPPTAVTVPLPAGIGVAPTSGPLLAVVGAGIRGGYADYSANPVIYNSIIHDNRAHYWDGSAIREPNVSPDWDLGVYGIADAVLVPNYSILTRTGPYRGQAAGVGNKTAAPGFVSPYRNTLSGTQGGAALGNFVQYAFSPMTLSGNYHITSTSAAVGYLPDKVAGATSFPGADNPVLLYDYDKDRRMSTGPDTPDMGGDEYSFKGDVNMDGVINSADVLLALRMYMGIPTAYDANKPLADVYPLNIYGRPVGNGLPLTLNDVLLLLQRASGRITW